MAGNRAVRAHATQVCPGLAFRNERRLSRALAISLFFCAIALLNAESLRAGCHYRSLNRGDRFLGYSEQRDTATHVPSIRFLGQWVYEGGDIKYVPWQGAPPCHGPDCQANDDSPVTSSLPPYRSLRNLPSPMAASAPLLNLYSTATVHLETESLRAFAGYPHEFEYPP